jgi:EpsD family peptidyl-prolyl cis-trans isomerase
MSMFPFSSNLTAPKVMAIYRLSLVAALAFAISACNQKVDPSKPTQVIANVNGTELSVHQLNFTLQGVQETDPERLARIRKAALDRLIEQEVVMQDAISKKLDRDPLVRSQLDAAQREVLVRNHLQNLGVSVSVPSDDLVAKFYGENPDLFKDRLVYQFNEIVLPRKPQNWNDIEKALAQAKTMSEILVELRKRGVSLPMAQNVVRAAEDLPQDSLKQFAKIKDDEIVVYGRPPAIIIAQITARKSVPLDEAKAKPAIVKYLMTQSKNDLVQSQVRRIMDAAKVSYVGEFAKSEKAADGEKSAVKATGSEKDNPDDVLAKGLKTLK